MLSADRSAYLTEADVIQDKLQEFNLIIKVHAHVNVSSINHSEMDTVKEGVI